MKYHPFKHCVGLFLVAAMSASGSVHYADVDNTQSTPPYDSWATAATNIQDAVDAAVAGDQILVTNGNYQHTLVDKALTLQSVNGPQFTFIDGRGTRCAVLTNGARLSGFTLTNGFNYSNYPETGGGGVAFSGSPSDAVVSNCVIMHCEAHHGGAAGSATSVNVYPPVGGTLVNCTIVSNTATGNPGQYFPLDAGGGVDSCRLINCRLIGNNASGPYGSKGGGAYCSILQNCLLVSNVTGVGSAGGGAANCALLNCTVVSNSASVGAGTYYCWLTNCIVYYNSETNHAADNSVAYSCTTPFADGTGNITSAPLFVNAEAGNYSLQAGSPCINAGNNAYVTTSADLDRRLRIVGDVVDIGAYEFVEPFNAWLQQYGLPTDGSADFTDSDGDGLNNYQESAADTVPTDSGSVLRMLNPFSAPSGVTVTWASVITRTYVLERAMNLGPPSAFSVIATNIVGQAGTTSFMDTNAIGAGPFFYRVGVRP